MTTLIAVIGFSLAWTGFGFTSGWLVSKVPVRWLAVDTIVTRQRWIERGGRIYERPFRIRKWKDRLPDGGDFFAGGQSKRTLVDRSTGGLARFAAETRRAEWVHWSNIAFGATFLLWTPRPIGLAMLIFGLAAHFPFIAVQRYNRARILRTLARARLKQSMEHDDGTGCFLRTDA